MPSSGGRRTCVLGIGTVLMVGILTHCVGMSLCGCLDSNTAVCGAGSHPAGLGAYQRAAAHTHVWLDCRPDGHAAAQGTSCYRVKPPGFWEAFPVCSSLGFHPTVSRRGEENKANKKRGERSLISPSAGAFLDSSVLLIWTFSLKTEFPFLGWHAGHTEDGDIVLPRVILPNPICGCQEAR